MTWFGEQIEGKRGTELDGMRKEPHGANVEMAL